MKYFVMIRHPSGKPIPLSDDDDWTVLFDSKTEAEKAASDNGLAAAYGFEVFEW